MARLTPISAGAFARAMDEILDERITGLTLPILDVFDPDKCPLALLPWLAYHLSLTHWSSAWPESVQRRVLREARKILRQRGTRAGVQRQLEAYGSAVRIVEWWEDDPVGTPGTWRVDVLLSEDVATDVAAQDEIAQAVRRTAPLTRPWTIDVGVPMDASTLVATKLRPTLRVYCTASSVG